MNAIYLDADGSGSANGVGAATAPSRQGSAAAPAKKPTGTGSAGSPGGDLGPVAKTRVYGPPKTAAPLELAEIKKAIGTVARSSNALAVAAESTDGSEQNYRNAKVAGDSLFRRR